MLTTTYPCYSLYPIQVSDHITYLGTLAFVLSFQIVDVDTGRALGPDKSGELWVKTATVMKGYLNDLKATAELIDPNGWLHTGELKEKTSLEFGLHKIAGQELGRADRHYYILRRRTFGYLDLHVRTSTYNFF